MRSSRSSVWGNEGTEKKIKARKAWEDQIYILPLRLIIKEQKECILRPHKVGESHCDKGQEDPVYRHMIIPR